MWHHWPRYRWDYLGRSRWEGWSTERYLGFGIAGALGAATFLELALVSGKGEPLTLLSELGLTPTGRAMILLLTAINAWILDRWISSHTRGDRWMSVWLRVLRPLTVGIPIIGLATVPAWRWIARTRPVWAFRKTRLESGPDLSAHAPSYQLPWWSVAERLLRPRRQLLLWSALWLIACQISPILGSVSWLAGSGPLEPSRQTAIVWASVVLHLTAALCGAFYGRNQADPSALRLRTLPWLLLLPGVGILSLAAIHLASFHPREEGLLLQVAHDRRRVRGMPVDALLDSNRRGGDAELQRLAFFRLKTLLLAFDAAALSWLTARFAGWSLGLSLTRFESGAALLLLPALPGLLLAASGLAARLSGRWPVLQEMERHSYGRYLGLVPIALLSGLVFGSLQAHGWTPWAGLFLFAAGLAALLLMLVWTPLSALVGSPVQSDPTVVCWFLLWFALALLGALLGSDGPAPSLLRNVETLLLLAPLWSLVLFLALGGWLLRPFTLRSLADRRLPLRARAILAIVVVSAALPLGGLAVPFWIYAHHRLWPDLERTWAAAVP
ncbi:MAG TPA: hypothetical protein VN493_08930 [Thermoanaerobaculia bacterium]|nr:hypothetical protein [Thermoanaerobaculia bacterium]